MGDKFVGRVIKNRRSAYYVRSVTTAYRHTNLTDVGIIVVSDGGTFNAETTNMQTTCLRGKLNL